MTLTPPTCPASTGDLPWMTLALEQAQVAARAGEVPVGAVVVRGGQLIAAAHNQPIALHDPSAHAEVLALRAAGQRLGNYRLAGCTLYTTLEPCVMCAGAIAQARLAALVWGAADPAAGALGSRLNLAGLIRAPQRSGVLAPDALALMQRFFQERRRAARNSVEFLRDDALRTPAARWHSCPDAPLRRQFCSSLPSAQRLRLSWLDNAVPLGRAPVGAGAAHAGCAQAGTALGAQADARPGLVPCSVAASDLARAASASTARQPDLHLYLHGPAHWSWVWRAALLEHAARAEPALALDWLGFGHSDKPKRAHWHSAAWHARVLFEWLDQLPAQPTHWVCAPELAPWLSTLAALRPQRVQLVVQRPPALVPAIAGAPYPDRGHAVAAQAWAHWGELGPTMHA